MSHLRALRLFAGLLGLVAFGSAVGQERPSVVTPGQVVDGVLTSRLPTLALLGNHPVRVYVLNADSAYTYRVTLRSSAFDSYLVVGRSVAGITDYVANDDDGGGGLDAMLRFQARATGPYLVLVTSARTTAHDRSDTGAFTLTVERHAPVAATQRPVTVGDSIMADLGDESAEDDATGAPYALYQLHAEQGHPVALDYEADSLSAAVVVGRMTGSRFVPMRDTLPDRGRSLASTFDPPETGDYTIRVIAAHSAGSGRYVLRVMPVVVAGASVASGATPTRSSAVAVGQDQGATLSGTPASWTLVVPRQQRISISLQSSVFDTFLWVGRDSAGQVIAVDSSDDAPGERTNSRLAFTTPGAGTYLLRVSAAVGTPRGAYMLRVDTFSVARLRLQRTRITAGREVDGTLSASDAMLTDGSPYQEWLYTPAQAGERLVITMRSREFDTYLAVGHLVLRNGRREFVPISVNDDGRDDDHKANRVSRVTLVAPDRQDLVIRANTWGPQAGQYTLELTTRPPDALSAALLHDPIERVMNPP